MNPLKMVQIGVLIGVVALAIAAKLLWDSNVKLRAENKILVEQAEIVEDNVIRLTKLLREESENRAAAETALSELAKDVPDEVYQEKLPPEIQRVLDGFHNRIRP